MDRIKYTIYDKKMLASKIHKIKRKDILVKIFEIIMTKNSETSYVEKENGIWIYFHQCSDETYSEIINLLTTTKDSSSNKFSIVSTECLGTECVDPELTETKTSQKMDESTETTEEITIPNIPKLKLSNKERTLLRRKKYNEIIDKSDDVIYQNFS